MLINNLEIQCAVPLINSGHHMLVNFATDSAQYTPLKKIENRNIKYN